MSENSSPTGQSSHADAIDNQISQYEDRNKGLAPRALSSQDKTAFMPVQSLAKKYNVDERPKIVSSPYYSDFPPLPQTGSIRLSHGQKHNSTPVENCCTTNILAGVTFDPITDLKFKMTVGNGAILKQADNSCDSRDRIINEHSKVIHSDILNGTRSRGESLERTTKERLTKEILSSDHTHKSEVVRTMLPETSHGSSNVSINHRVHPLEIARTKYSSWRRNLPKIPAEKAWSIEETGSAGTRGGNVEKSVKEALSGVEQSTRSRKASHSLRFFREGLTPEDSRSREYKGRGLSKEANSFSRTLQPRYSENSQSKPRKDIEQLANKYAYSSSIQEGKTLSSQNTHKTLSKAEHVESIDCSESSQNFEKKYLEVASSKKAEIDTRGYQNNTQNLPTKDSFLQGLPLVITERPKENELSDSQREKLDQFSFNSNGVKHTSRSRNSEDDEDSGEEKISSAIFLPHQMTQEASRRHGERLDPISNSSNQETSSPEEWFEEHILSRKNSESCSHQSKTALSLFNNAESTLKISTDDNDNFTNTNGKLDMRINTRDEQLLEKGLKNQTQYEEVTPTGSPKLYFPSMEEASKSCTDLQPVIKKPLEAIELIPYSHQVGGHTTLWRFSKRAVCKQLNNRENEFYEKIEQRHPQLLRFLPRYIGVLNVTFERQNRSKNSRKEVQESPVETLDSKQYDSTQVTYGQDISPVFKNGEQLENITTQHKRAKSQSCISDHLQPVPTVTFADNRHIIPTSILKPQPVYSQNQHRSYSASSSFSQTIDHELNDDRRISLNLSRDSSEPNPWGKTFVNKVLREDVFREVFLQKPVAIRHKKSSAHRSSAYCSSNFLRISNSESNLQTIHQVKKNNESPLRINANVSREHLAPKESTADNENCTLEDSNKSFGCEISANDRVGRSVQKSKAICAGFSKSGKRQRRYSSGGLRRRPTEVADDRGSLKYYEEADDTVPESNSDEIFSMEPGSTNCKTYISKTKNAQVVLEKIHSTMEENDSSNELSKSVERHFIAEGNSVPDPSNSQIDIPRPVNPKEARAQPGSRVEYFLLLEDLTAGMKRPCVMDLKMGTRQYGVDCDLKKQESQRKKCAATTSRRFGVRVCGLQVWDVYLQDYIFEDKYYGRNLKNGEDFQKALTRFLYDGLDYYSVLRHIPSIIEKLSELEVLIRGLIGYRFYGTSLLMFYDGATEEGYSSDSTATEKEDRSISRGIDFKIADFANCVTQEDFERQRTCPPKHPKKPDLGFLRGLKTLKRYFLAIERDTRKEKGYTHFQNTRIGKEFNSPDESDEGYVSY
ncbi:hypothetical protein EPUL_005408 [Erysiphe pulchra]|uniref:Kinase n=1 Tax=Erysiphe pulchra TaxID=225359 RepID=A0A2S4PU09_9PEZI|nr:hypothetical protein EPUL_005408 [Erysiphe pulchra]